MAYANVKPPETYIILCINYISIKRTLQLIFSNSTRLNKSIVNRFIKNQIPSLVQYITKILTSSLWASGSVSEALVFKSCSLQTSFSARLEKEAHLRSGIPTSHCIISSTDKHVTWSWLLMRCFQNPWCRWDARVLPESVFCDSEII